MKRAEYLAVEKGEGRELWSTTGDLAKALNAPRRNVVNWLRRGQIPEPEARSTTQGWALWSPETAARIVRDRTRRPLA